MLFKGQQYYNIVNITITETGFGSVHQGANNITPLGKGV